MNATVSRAYRYALLLTVGQEEAVQRQERQLRFAWNKLVNWQRCALRDWKFGRQTTLLNEYRGILEDKNGNTGQASPKARYNAALKREAQARAKAQDIPVEVAADQLASQNFQPAIPSRAEMINGKISLLQHGDPTQAVKRANSLAKDALTKDEKMSPEAALEAALEAVKAQGYGANGTGTGPRRLGVELAQERLMAKAENFYGGQKPLLYGMIQKFQKSCENWLKGIAQEPCYKRFQDSVALQRQIVSNCCAVGPETNLSVMIGQAGKRCRVAWHRPLPDGATIKQLAITGRPGKRFMVVMLTCPRASVLKPFAKSDRYAGIDTGYQCALTVVSDAYTENCKTRRAALDADGNLALKLANDPDSSDGKALAGALGNLEQYVFSDNGALELQPRLARDKHFLARLRKMQRKMDRQKRAANPECFNPDGTWVKGKRAKHITSNLVETHKRIQRMHEHQADSRRDFYHVAAFQLLKQHGHIAIGDWRAPALHKQDKPAPKGMAKKRRNINRKGLDHAIASFKAILKDKASLSANPRTVEVIDEAYTTRTCACCKTQTGPEGPTSVVHWTCAKCGTENHKKANAAENIRQRSILAAQSATAGAQPVAVPA